MRSRARARAASSSSRKAMNRGPAAAISASTFSTCSGRKASSLTTRLRNSAIGPRPADAADGAGAGPLGADAAVPPVVAAGAGSTPAIRTRRAALGTFSTSSRASVTTLTLAVMPGSRRPLALENPITAV